MPRQRRSHCTFRPALETGVGVGFPTPTILLRLCHAGSVCLTCQLQLAAALGMLRVHICDGFGHGSVLVLQSKVCCQPKTETAASGVLKETHSFSRCDDKAQTGDDRCRRLRARHSRPFASAGWIAARMLSVDHRSLASLQPLAAR